MRKLFNQQRVDDEPNLNMLRDTFDSMLASYDPDNCNRREMQFLRQLVELFRWLPL